MIVTFGSTEELAILTEPGEQIEAAVGNAGTDEGFLFEQGCSGSYTFAKKRSLLLLEAHHEITNVSRYQTGLALNGSCNLFCLPALRVSSQQVQLSQTLYQSVKFRHFGVDCELRLLRQLGAPLKRPKPFLGRKVARVLTQLDDPEQFRDCWSETLKREAARFLTMVLLFYFSNRAASRSMILLLRTAPAKLMEIAAAVSKLIH